MRTATILLMLLAVAACGAGNNTVTVTGDSGGETTGGKSEAGVNGEMKPLVTSAASWNPDAKVVKFAMASFEMTEDQATILVDSTDGMHPIPSELPYVVITFDIKDAGQPLSKDNISAWRVAYWNFHEKDPMTDNRMGAEGISAISGDLKDGSQIQLQLSASFDWTMEPKRKYDCRVNASAIVTVLN